MSITAIQLPPGLPPQAIPYYDHEAEVEPYYEGEMKDEFSPSQELATHVAVHILVSYIFLVLHLFKESSLLQVATSENSRTKMDSLIRSYLKSTEDSATLQKRVGWEYILTACASLGAFGAGTFRTPFSRHEDDRKLCELFSTHLLPKAGDMFVARTQAGLTTVSNKAQLDLQRFTAESNKAQSEGGSSRGENFSLVQAVLQALSTAGRAN